MQATEQATAGGMDHKTLRQVVASVVANPEGYADDETFGELAAAMVQMSDDGQAVGEYVGRDSPAPWKQWGTGLEQSAIQQMKNACDLPITVCGALMPDAHQGYGLPIGGVMATDNAVVPYAVGVDIACRMKMTVLDIPPAALTGQQQRLRNAIEAETRFGVGVSFAARRQHDVMDRDWSFSKVVAGLKDKAHSQLGTSGAGNHFVEFGTLTLEADELGLKAGVYLALLSHSGSRGTGATIADHYSHLAMKRHAELPRELMHLAWLGLDSELGQEYWQAMELMGVYASANHELIHRSIVGNLGAAVLLDIENHHNFAWLETHGGREVVVHRKGATPAGVGAIGIIPGTMATPGYVVRGLGNDASLHSAAHGAGRRMSRTAAKKSLNWSDAKKFIADRGVTVISAGLDEVPMVYKDIESVMGAQRDLVATLARFDPKLVKMAEPGRPARKRRR